MSAPDPVRLKRLRIRAWRRGTREADLILGGFVDACGDRLDAEGLAAIEALLEESDADIFAWVSGRAAPPAAHAGVVARIAAHATRG